MDDATFLLSIAGMFDSESAELPKPTTDLERAIAYWKMMVAFRSLADAAEQRMNTIVSTKLTAEEVGQYIKETTE